MPSRPPRNPSKDHDAIIHLSVLGELAGGIAHQLSTPLQLVSTNLHFLKRAWPTIEARIVPDLDAGAPSDELRFTMEEAPKALAQSLESLNDMALLLRTMKEWCAPPDGTTHAVDPSAALRSVLRLTQHRWRYLFDVAQNVASPLPVLRCVPREIAAALTQLLLLVADAHASRAGDDHPTVDVSCRGENDCIAFDVTWNGSPPSLDSGPCIALKQLAVQMQADLVIDTNDSSRTTVRLRVPCDPSAPRDGQL